MLSRHAQRSFQLVNPLARARTDGDDGRVFEKRSGNQAFGLRAHQLQQIFFDQILFGDDDHTLAHAKQPADIEMLARLWHHALVGGDDQSNDIDTVRTGQHVFDEALVPRHVHKAYAHVAEIQIGKAYVDGDPAPLLFRQTVGIDAGQRAHQRRLAVIDVTRGANDYGSGQ